MLIRPSYVLGGRGMERATTTATWISTVEGRVCGDDRVAQPQGEYIRAGRQFRLDATEIDVDAVADFSIRTIRAENASSAGSWNISSRPDA